MEKKRTLTLPKILAEAMTLADAEGLAALSMRRLASGLGVEAASLYNHIGSKEALLDQMAEAVVAEIAPARPGPDWRRALRAHFLSAEAALIRHPWASVLLVSRPNMGPFMLARIENLLATLTGAGYPLIAADHIWNMLDSLLHGHRLLAMQFPLRPEEYADQAAAHAHLIPPDIFPNLRGLADLVATRQHDGLHPFAPALDQLLAGLAPP